MMPFMKETPAPKATPIADASDIALLRSVVDAGGVTKSEHAELVDHIARLTKNGGKLSKKDRSKAMAIADRCGVQVAANLVSRGLVPRGNDVETPWVLRRENLPMKPPGRK